MPYICSINYKTTMRRQNYNQILAPLSLAAALLFAPSLSAKSTKSTNNANSNKKTSSKPNIIMILTDDMGYSDLGCYGSEIHTPNIDKLAAEGVRFTHCYNSSRSCPSRAAILTGLYPSQAGIGNMASNAGYPGYEGELSPSSVSLAEALKVGGYNTYMVGKWHVSHAPNDERSLRKANMPFDRGFDKSYGILNGATSYWDPATLFRGDKLITMCNDPEYKPKGEYYLTDAITDNACRYIEESTSGEPLFMYVAYSAAHWPIQARPEDIAKYKGVYDEGYDAIRRARFERMKKLGVIDPDTEFSPTVGKWSNVKDKAFEARRMEVYAAMIDRMDQGVGEIIEALKRRGEYENTLILFAHDNGGCPEEIDGLKGASSPEQQRADRPTLPPIADDVQHYFNSAPKQTRDGWPMLFHNVMPGAKDTYFSYGRNWANVSNTPLREYKRFEYEGGVSTPLIAHWGGGIKRKNFINNMPCHIIDIMATCVDVAGVEYPKERRGVAVTPMEGISLRGSFEREVAGDRHIYFYHFGNRAVRDNEWKLVAKIGGDWELYNINDDRPELHNLRAEKPEIAERLAKAWDEWALRTGVVVKSKGKWIIPKSKNIEWDGETGRSSYVKK